MRHRGFEPRTTWLKVKCSTNWANIPYQIKSFNWARWIWTTECSSQSAVPYRLAIAHYKCTLASITLKGGYRDSNPGPPDPQSGALTDCAIPTIVEMRYIPISQNVLEGIRTPDPRLRRPLLYPTELRTHEAGDGNRTSDTRIFSPLLYRLSYLGIK